MTYLPQCKSIIIVNCPSWIFSKFVDLSDSVNNVFDAIVVSETHLDSSTDDLVNLAGYTFTGKHRT